MKMKMKNILKPSLHRLIPSVFLIVVGNEALKDTAYNVISPRYIHFNGIIYLSRTLRFIDYFA